MTVHAVISDNHYTSFVSVIGSSIPPFAREPTKVGYNGIFDLTKPKHCQSEMDSKFKVLFNEGMRVMDDLGRRRLAMEAFTS